jgi:hypothetical protein
MSALEEFTREVTDHLETRMRKETLKYAAGRAIFCPTCGTIMDYRRTALIDIYGTDNSRMAKAYCTNCVDDDTIDRLRQMVADDTNPVRRVEIDTLNNTIVFDNGTEAI